MAAYLVPPEADAPPKDFRLPPSLDMGRLKLEDLSFDLDEAVARLRRSAGGKTSRG